jgi:hypothetical protein
MLPAYGRRTMKQCSAILRLQSTWTPQDIDENRFHSLADTVLHEVDETLEGNSCSSNNVDIEHAV